MTDEHYSISPLQCRHLKPVYALACEQFGKECWTEKQFAVEADNPQRNNFVLTDKTSGEVLCFLIAINSETECEILYIATAESHKNQGLASLLFDEILKQKKDIFLEVKESNLPAISFYSKHGFSEFSRRKKYYPDGSDAVLMRRIGVVQ